MQQAYDLCLVGHGRDKSRTNDLTYLLTAISAIKRERYARSRSISIDSTPRNEMILRDDIYSPLIKIRILFLSKLVIYLITHAARMPSILDHGRAESEKVTSAVGSAYGSASIPRRKATHAYFIRINVHATVVTDATSFIVVVVV